MKTAVYPNLSIDRNLKPNKLYAVPILGLLIKLIMLIPVLIVAWIVSMATGILVMLINPLVVLITGQYWSFAHQAASAMLIYTSNFYFFATGLTDKYPGFDLKPTNYQLTIPKPASPNRLYSIPLVGILIRAVLIIPYIIFVSVLKYAAYLGVFISSIRVLFQGQYPEGTYELARDFQRVQLAQTIYLFGLSDTYPSFKISWSHKNLKVALIVIGAALLILQLFSSLSQPKTSHPGKYPTTYSTSTY